MSELRELYQEVILDHGKSPRNFGKPPAVTGESHGHNPLCGDTVTIYVDVADGVVTDIGFEGRGCAISMASASMMTELLRGKSIDDVEAMFLRVPRAGGVDGAGLRGGLRDARFGQADRARRRAGSSRCGVKCATLPWHTMKAALEGEAEAEEVTTE